MDKPWNLAQEYFLEISRLLKLAHESRIYDSIETWLDILKGLHDYTCCYFEEKEATAIDKMFVAINNKIYSPNANLNRSSNKMEIAIIERKIVSLLKKYNMLTPPVYKFEGLKGEIKSFEE